MDPDADLHAVDDGDGDGGRRRRRGQFAKSGLHAVRTVRGFMPDDWSEADVYAFLARRLETCPWVAILGRGRRTLVVLNTWRL